MIRYIHDFTTVTLGNGTKVFEKGCMNCIFMGERISDVSGLCRLRDNYKVWKDWACEKHDPIVRIENDYQI